MNKEKEYMKAVRYVSGLITDHGYRKNESLPPEREIAEHLQISRNSVREGLRVLENLGVIESKRGSGNYVSGDFSRTMADMMEIMIVLEDIRHKDVVQFRRYVDKAVCISIMENGTIGKYTEKLRKIIEKMHNEDSLEGKVKHDQEFHFALVEASENKLWGSICRAITRIYRDWIFSTNKRITEDSLHNLSELHQNILNALNEGNKEKCMAAIDKHYDFIGDVIQGDGKIELIL